MIPLSIESKVSNAGYRSICVLKRASRDPGPLTFFDKEKVFCWEAVSRKLRLDFRADLSPGCECCGVPGAGDLMEPWPLLLVLFWCCCLVVSRAEGITSTLSGEMPFVQSFRDPKYKVEFHSLDSPFLMNDNQEKIPMMDRDGKKYVCALSNPRVSHGEKTGDGQNSSRIGLVTDERSTRKSPEELLDILKDLCFRRDDAGWWSYTLCFKGDVRQFHVDTSNGNKKGQITQEFILGQYDEKATAELHRKSEEVFVQKDPRSQTAAQRYHAHVHTNGTKCDLTNEPRETEVRYVCSGNGQQLIRSIKEAPSCKYTVVVHVPELCKHSLFQEEQSPWVPIHCNEVA